MSYHILFDLYINASKETIFNAFTQPEHLDNWWTLKSSGTPQKEAIYNLNFTDHYDWYAEVVEVEMYTNFYLKMTKSDTDWNTTIFGITLETHQNNTLLKFSHTNWQNNNHHYRYSAFCWAQLLKGLKNYVEKGIVIPFENRE